MLDPAVSVRQTALRLLDANVVHDRRPAAIRVGEPPKTNAPNTSRPVTRSRPAPTAGRERSRRPGVLSTPSPTRAGDRISQASHIPGDAERETRDHPGLKVTKAGGRSRARDQGSNEWLEEPDINLETSAPS